MKKQIILNEINELTKAINQESKTRDMLTYLNTGSRLEIGKTLSDKMNKDVYAKNLNGKYYIPKSTKKCILENLLTDLINFCYDNKIISSAWDLQ